MKMFFYNVTHVGLMVVQFVFCIACRQNISKHNMPQAIINRDTLYSFDINKKSITQPYDQGTMTASCKFVQVEVIHVVNPKMHPVTFEVRYQIEGQEKILLGSFSLYPSDNPGKFIVPTQGKLSKPGSIILSLIVPPEVLPGDTLEISAKQIGCIVG